MLWFFGYEACGIFTPQPRIKPAPPNTLPTLEGEVLATGPPEKSQYGIVYYRHNGSPADL